jgi:hypothetical protein
MPECSQDEATRVQYTILTIDWDIVQGGLTTQQAILQQNYYYFFNLIGTTVLRIRIRDLVLFYPLDPDPG